MMLDQDAMKRAFPWAPSFRAVLSGIQPTPFSGSHVLIGSDYSGSHRASSYLTYAFLAIDTDASRYWVPLRKRWRESLGLRGRRMSFKALNDKVRRRALIPFLEMADVLVGLCLVVVIHKNLRYLTSTPIALELWRSFQGLEAKWEPQAFESLARAAHFFALIVSVISSPLQHITWITDEDEIVANDARLTDALILASKMSGLYVGHKLGELAMNTTQVGKDDDYALEDFVALPDLVAGTFSEVISRWSSQPGWSIGGYLNLESQNLSSKASLIYSWFSAAGSTLKRASVIVDPHGEGFRVRSMNPIE